MIRDKYMKGVKELEKYYAFPKKHEEIMKIIPLVKNGSFLIYGPYGYGKTVYADLVGKIFFSGEVGKVNLNNELGIHDVFFWIDAGQLAQGKEVVEPRKIITSPFKFINELQRGNGRIYNTLLSLMSERMIVYRDKIFKTPNYVMIMDSNPFDSASVEIPYALLDRITVSFTMLTPDEEEREKLMYLEHSSAIEEASSVMDYRDMEKIWSEVEKVKVPEDLKFLLIELVHNYLNNCVKGNKELFSPEMMREMCKVCRWKHEPCSEIVVPLGQRWWIDVVKISKARAYYENRDEVTQEDMYFSIPYVLPHRVMLSEETLVSYGAKELWAEQLVKRIKTELKTRWIPALNGNEKAYKDAERTLIFVRRAKNVGRKGVR